GSSQLFPLLAGQVLARLATIFEQAEADFDFALLGLGTPAFEGTAGTVLTGVDPPLGGEAIVGGKVGGGLIVQGFVRRAEKGVRFLVVAEVLRPELVGAHSLWIPVGVGILVEGVVLQEVLHLL